MLIAAGAARTACVAFVSPGPPSFSRLLADRADVSASRPGVALQRLDQPPDTLADVFPGLPRLESEFALMGQPGLSTRAGTLGRMSAPELVAMYEASTARATFLHALATEVSSEIQNVGKEISEVLMFMTLHRMYDVRRVPAVTLPADADTPDTVTTTPAEESASGA